jgi:2'-5' RNA ligase
MTKRIFIAFPVNDAVRTELGGVIRVLASRTDRTETVRWVDPAEMHITAHFLGDFESVDTENIKRVCEAVSREFKPSVARLKAVSAFPEHGAPRVITVSVIEDHEMTLRRIQAALGVRLVKLGYAIDRRVWTPHITLGRVKTEINPEKLKDIEVKPVEFEIQSIELLESQRDQNGAHYEPIQICKLAS